MRTVYFCQPDANGSGNDLLGIARITSLLEPADGGMEAIFSADVLTVHSGDVKDWTGGLLESEFIDIVTIQGKK